MRNHSFFYFRARKKGQAEPEGSPLLSLSQPCSLAGEGVWRRTARPSASRLQKLWRGSALPRLLGLCGGTGLAAGAAAPLIHIPIAGTISFLRHPSYFSSCNIGEVVILAAAGLSIVCALLNGSNRYVSRARSHLPN